MVGDDRHDDKLVHLIDADPHEIALFILRGRREQWRWRNPADEARHREQQRAADAIGRAGSRCETRALRNELMNCDLRGGIRFHQPPRGLIERRCREAPACACTLRVKSGGRACRRIEQHRAETVPARPGAHQIDAAIGGFLAASAALTVRASACSARNTSATFWNATRTFARYCAAACAAASRRLCL